MSDKLIVYLDTSALAKWYLLEANSDLAADYIISPFCSGQQPLNVPSGVANPRPGVLILYNVSYT
jgi:hypothetical protein